jgi:hypothetical protein
MRPQLNCQVWCVAAVWHGMSVVWEGVDPGERLVSYADLVKAKV